MRGFCVSGCGIGLGSGLSVVVEMDLERFLASRVVV